MFILDDVDSDRLALPKQYGIHDVPRIVEDKAFNGDCSFKERRPLFASLGPLGDEILVNDTYDAYFRQRQACALPLAQQFAGAHLRLRLSRRSQLPGHRDRRRSPRDASRDGARAALARRARRDRRQVRAGRDDDAAQLRPRPRQDFYSERLSGGDDTFDILQIRASERLAESAPLPDTLMPKNEPDTDEIATTRTFRLSGSSINGQKMDLTFQVDVEERYQELRDRGVEFALPPGKYYWGYVADVAELDDPDSYRILLWDEVSMSEKGGGS